MVVHYRLTVKVIGCALFYGERRARHKLEQIVLRKRRAVFERYIGPAVDGEKHFFGRHRYFALEHGNFYTCIAVLYASVKFKSHAVFRESLYDFAVSPHKP